MLLEGIVRNPDSLGAIAFIAQYWVGGDSGVNLSKNRGYPPEWRFSKKGALITAFREFGFQPRLRIIWRRFLGDRNEVGETSTAPSQRQVRRWGIIASGRIAFSATMFSQCGAASAPSRVFRKWDASPHPGRSDPMSHFRLSNEVSDMKIQEKLAARPIKP